MPVETVLPDKAVQMFVVSLPNERDEETVAPVPGFQAVDRSDREFVVFNGLDTCDVDYVFSADLTEAFFFRYMGIEFFEADPVADKLFFRFLRQMTPRPIEFESVLKKSAVSETGEDALDPFVESASEPLQLSEMEAVNLMDDDDPVAVDQIVEPGCHPGHSSGFRVVSVNHVRFSLRKQAIQPEEFPDDGPYCQGSNHGKLDHIDTIVFHQIRPISRRTDDQVADVSSVVDFFHSRP